MNIKVQIPSLKGKWTAPASKSELIRYLAIAMQCPEKSIIRNVTVCNDVYSMIKIAEAWGAEIAYDIEHRMLAVQGCTEPQSKIFNAGESALCLRLMVPILARFSQTSTLQAEGTLLNRPIGEIETILNQAGAKIQSNNGLPPIKIKGKIKPSNFSIEFILSSQNISGLLFSLPLLDGDTFVKLKKIISLPYIKVSLKCLEQAGIQIAANETYTEFNIRGNQTFRALEVDVEGDWSAASVLIAGAAVSGDVALLNLNFDSMQADKQILNFVKLNKNKIKTQQINSIRYDITHCPDLFPALVVLATHAQQISEISGINRLFHKESNRIETFMEEFSKFGIKFNLSGDTLTIKPPDKISSCEIDSHNDHRIVMAAAMVVTGTKASVVIKNAESVNKSYPSFWEDIKCLGARIQQV